MRCQIRDFAIQSAIASAVLLIGCTGRDTGDGGPTPTPGEPAASATTAVSPPTIPSEQGSGELKQIRVEKPITPTSLSLILASDQAAPVSERMPTRIDRATFDQSGVVHVETLLEAQELGWRQFLTVAVTADGTVMVVTQCTRGDCALMGSTPSADAQTTLVRSVDGGQTWKVWAILDGTYSAIQFVGDDLLLSRFIGVEQTSQGGRARRTYSRYPSGDPVEEPAGSYGSPPFITRPGGEILWQSGIESGVFLRSDGSRAIKLDVARWDKASIAAVLRFEDGRWATVLVGPGCERADGRPGECVALFRPDGSLAAAYAGAPHIYDLVRGARLIVGSAGFLGLAAIRGPDAVPSTIDLAAGEIRPIADPFMAEPWLERDRMRLLALVEE